MCDYQGYEFGAGSYPDSVCIEGFLYDADDCDSEGGIYLHEDEEHIPCPKCNKDKYDEYVAENKTQAESKDSVD